jgi:23S rRNA (guanosine2251-2'-O)-methyltransferase
MRKKDRHPGQQPSPGRRGRSRSERGDDRKTSGSKAFGDHPRSERFEPDRKSFKPKSFTPKGAGGKPFRDRGEAERPFKAHGPERAVADREARPRKPFHERGPGESGGHERPLRPRADKPFTPRGDKPFTPRTDKPLAAKGRAGDRPERGRSRVAKKFWQTRRDPDGPVLLYGWHTVKAALENPARNIRRLLASEGAAQRLADEIELAVTPEIVEASGITALTGPDAVHQGLAAEADPLDAPTIDDLDVKGIVLVLDQITDPHNVGAMLRSAAAFSVEAIVTTERHSPESTGVLAKAASGALEYVPVVTVVNLARGLEALKDKGVMIVGLDSAGDVALAAAPLKAPLALVLGAEGKGLRHLTRQNCDVLARLDLPGRIKSLNVSNATALALQIAHTKLGG